MSRIGQSTPANQAFTSSIQHDSHSQSDQMNVSGFPTKKQLAIIKGQGIPAIMPNNFVSPNQGRAKSHFRGVTNAMDLLSNNSLALGN